MTENGKSETVAAVYDRRSSKMKYTTQRRSKAAEKAWLRMRSAKWKANKSERGSKQALTAWCKVNGWKVIFFEGKTGAARTGIVDAIITRIRPSDADGIDIRLVQLKSGAGGLTAKEIARLKSATERASKDWLLAAFDGQQLHFLPEMIARRVK